jgi:hypothetical protein
MFIIKNSIFSNILYVISLTFLFINNSYGWTIEDSFENGTLGTKILLPGPAVGDAAIDAQGNTVYSDEMAFTGNRSAKLTITGPTAMELADPTIDRGRFGSWGARYTFPEKLKQGEEIWVRLSVFFPVSFDFTTNFSLKFLRFHVKEVDGSHLGYTDIYINNDLTLKYQNELYTTSRLILSVEDSEGIFQVGDTITGRTSGASAVITAVKSDKSIVYDSVFGAIERYEWIDGSKSGASAKVTLLSSNSVHDFAGSNTVTRGVWETYYYNVRFGSNLSTVNVWKIVDGKLKSLLAEYTDKTMKAPTDVADTFLLFTYWNGGATQTQSMYVDDILISTERPAEINVPKPPTLNIN